MDKICLSVDETAKELGITPARVYTLCNDPSFPSVRISPRRIIIPADGLKRWLEEQSGKKVG